VLKALALGIDGVFVGESESKSSPYAGIGPALSRNIEQTRAILREHGIEPERVRAKEFVTIMLGGFVAQLNELTAFAEAAGPIPEEKRKALEETVANGLPRAEAQVTQ
jgi:coenzyme F420-reducing hydrogenase delta subunit